MKPRQDQVDAFARRVLEGNPAAVCPLDAWLSDEVLQAIAGGNDLSETAFLVQTDDTFHRRWFTRVADVDLCGHATPAEKYRDAAREADAKAVGVWLEDLRTGAD